MIRLLSACPGSKMLCWLVLLMILAHPLAEASKSSGLSIIVLKDSNHGSALKTLEAICSENNAALSALGLSNECYLGPTTCKHIYRNTVRGISGTFSAAQIRRLKESCLPGAIHYHEGDGTVSKMEDERHFTTQSSIDIQKYKQLHLGPDYPATGQKLTARRFLNGQPTEPTVRPLTEFERDSAEDGGVINVWALSQGLPIDAPSEKLQKLNTKLWNLDRIDQRDLPLDGAYVYGQLGDPGLGQGATIYIIDSGINLNHQEFWQGASNTSTNTTTPQNQRVSYGWNIIDNNGDAFDEDGHGSHVAGIAAGLQVGVAKGANVVAVKILNQYGLGTVSDTVAALDWIATYATGPSVVTMSLGVAQGSYSRAMEAAVKSLAVDHGITVVVAAGNTKSDACKTSPALVPEAITVAASDLPGKYRLGEATKTLVPDGSEKRKTSSSPPESESLQTGETVYVDSNQGACVDLFAPGVDIWSVCGGARRCTNVKDNTYAFASGTSMSVPHVAGAAAIYLSRHPDATPEEVRQALVGGASLDKIAPGLLKAGTPNRLLMTRMDSPLEVQSAQGP